MEEYEKFGAYERKKVYKKWEGSDIGRLRKRRRMPICILDFLFCFSFVCIVVCTVNIIKYFSELVSLF